MIALTRAVSDSLSECELTHLARIPIDLAQARAQHAQYEAALRALGCDVVRLAPLHDHPDAVFVEDTVVVVRECAVITRPGAASRRGESASMRSALAPLLLRHEIEAPGTLDGGDVLRIGMRIFVGVSTRTNAHGTAQLERLLAPFGYTVTAVYVRDCLHLKSAVTAVNEDFVVVNPNVVDPELFGVEWLAVPDEEAIAANILSIGDHVLCPAAAPRTADMLARRGCNVIPVDNSELAKAEAGLTCCSVILPDS